jgi:excinuclease ABC subunit C
MSEADEQGGQPNQLRDAEIAPERKTLAEILERLPTEPGVYLMKDRRGKMLYIGKAANLRNRVRQYFQPATGDTRDFVPLLEGVVADIETVVTRNEKEALLLENTLVKRHQPRFNVKLTDDKNFLSLRLDPKAEWPRLEVVRRMADDGAWYFGPYHSASACREALRVVNRQFRLRTCTDHVLHHRSRPCLQCQINRCLGPCCLPVSREEYAEQVRDVRLFLEGKNDELLTGLRQRMREAAQQTHFERAGLLRDQIRALETVLESQHMVSADAVDQDVIGYHREGMALEIVVMTVRQGKMVGSRAFSFTRQEFPDAEILSSFLGLYYDLAPVPPDEVLLPFAIADADLKAEWLGEKRGKKVQVLVPARGPRHQLVELAHKNAAANFVSRRDREQDAQATLGRLQRRLSLHRYPKVIECYDISHLQGSETVASMVVFVEGQPEKSRYRTYKIRTAESPDDFACMYEVLSRRFRRAVESSRAGEPTDDSWRLPDLLVVDGGKGQLGVALAAARDVGIDVRPGVGLPIIALAKERDAAMPLPAETPPPESEPPSESVPAETTSSAEPTGNEAEPSETSSAAVPTESSRRGKAKPTEAPGKNPDRVFLPQAKDAIPIRPNSAEMFVLQRLRDEAHRFAVTFHRSQRRKRTLSSSLSQIPGIGPTRQRALLRHFGSLRKIREATPEELLQVPGMSRTAAEAVHQHLAAQADQTPTTPAPAPAETDDADQDALESAFSDLPED